MGPERRGMIDEKHRSSTGGIRRGGVLLGIHPSWLKNVDASKVSMRWLRRSSWRRKESQVSASSTTALVTGFLRGRTPPPTPASPLANYFGEEPFANSVWRLGNAN